MSFDFEEFSNCNDFNELTAFFALELLPKLYDKKDEYIGNLVFLFEEESIRKLLIEKIDAYLIKYENFHQEDLNPVKRYIDNPFLSGLPIIRIRNFKDFIFLIRDIYRSEFSRLHIYEFCLYGVKIFTDIWLRASPLDLMDVNRFLRKQLEMYHDDTFNEFKHHQKIAEFPSLGMFMMAKSEVCFTYEECPSEMIFRFYHKIIYNYNCSTFFEKEKNYYELPRVRYGIYEENGKKICRIGSIQDKNCTRDTRKYDKDICGWIAERINIFKLGIIGDKHKNVEPNKMISLVLFLFYLFKNGITKIEIPIAYFNNYDYHIKERKRLEKGHEKVTCNEDVVSALKSEKLFRVVLKTVGYFEDASVLDLDNRILIDIGNINLTNNQFIQDLYKRLEERYSNIISSHTK